MPANTKAEVEKQINHRTVASDYFSTYNENKRKEKENAKDKCKKVSKNEYKGPLHFVTTSLEKKSQISYSKNSDRSHSKIGSPAVEKITINTQRMISAKSPDRKSVG